MRIERMSPAAIAPPIARYSHLVRVSGDADWLFISGQVGFDQDGALPADVAAQARNVFDNIERLLASQGAAPSAIVRLLTFLVGEEHMAGFAGARDEAYERWFPAGDFPGHSLAIVPALARPGLLIEMEGWAAVPAPRLD